MCCNGDPDDFDFERVDHSGRSEKPESPTGAAQSGAAGEAAPSVADSLAPHLRAEFEELRRHDETITTALRDDDFAQRMLDDPLAALTEVGIEVAPIIKRQLKRSSGRGAPGMLQATPQSYLLPNGQVVTTTPRIRITGVRGRGA